MIKSKGEKVYQVVINILLVIVTLCMILPLVLLFMCSITDENTLVANGYSFFPAKFGLSAYNINLYRDRPALDGEVTGEPWIDFGQDAPDGPLAAITNSAMSRGFHARGCGNTDMNEAYTIEKQPSAADTLLWVEDQIMDEYVLETALEGNRFHDLMRISRYRQDPAYLADRVASKFPQAERASIRTRLMDEHNWYLPHSDASRQN